MKHTAIDFEVEPPAPDASRFDPLDLPFDQYQRYRLIARIAEHLRYDGERLRVLDIGGRTGALKRFLPHDKIFAVDVEPGPTSSLVLGSGDALPVRSNAFDLVVSADTLEHVPPVRRDAFVREACRAASRWVVIAGPYQDARVEEVEEILASFVEEKLRMQHRYLSEHRILGLPDRGRVERLCSLAGAREVHSYGHGDLRRWLGLMCLGLLVNDKSGLTATATRLHRFYNEQLFDSDVSDAVYRHAVVATFDERPLPRLGDLFHEEATEPDAGPTLAGLALDFDRERLTALAERASFMRERDEFRKQAEEFEQVKAELLERVQFEENVVAEQNHGLEELRAELTQKEQEARQVLAEKDRGLEELRAELERTQQEARQLEDQLRTTQAEAEASDARLVESDRELGALRRLANGRLRCIKRALRLSNDRFGVS